MIENVVFDLGGVLIDWNPRYLYRRLLPSEEEVEWFLNNVCTQDWNIRQDAGRPFEEAVEVLAGQYPQYEPLIRAYWERWPETLGGAIDGTVALLRSLRRRKIPVFALSNWSAETFPVARRRFEFLEWFDGLLISGEVGVAKPDARIFQELVRRFRINPEASLFIDDSEANVESAKDLGFHALHFEDSNRLQRDLQNYGLLDPGRPAGVT